MKLLFIDVKQKKMNIFYSYATSDWLKSNKCKNTFRFPYEAQNILCWYTSFDKTKFSTNYINKCYTNPFKEKIENIGPRQQIISGKKLKSYTYISCTAQNSYEDIYNFISTIQSRVLFFWLENPCRLKGERRRLDQKEFNPFKSA